MASTKPKAPPKPLGISLVDHLVKGSKSPVRRKMVMQALTAPLKDNYDLMPADEPKISLLGMPMDYPQIKR